MRSAGGQSWPASRTGDYAGGLGPGARANAVLVAGLLDLASALLDESRAYNNWQIGLRGDTTTPALAEATRKVRDVLRNEPQRVLPQVDERALRTLKFAELLPPSLAASTLAERNSDHAGASVVAARSVVSV
ncbi:hypothetical protein HAV21_04170 [Paenarthrobacter sp. MSM-2-10-13]|uniref:hypothetical protein n=1 Tax=Paenarthrobacter sp. MSM-2-10-13 TaxID=2717318 RepID=UPI0014220560|nr:hypothetical protein [Paenarthrobacter sp. MSM-2-10-13]NHW46088.1 hypothetical protein [Paenarthrobacter sp. MSM-2-10-13]